LESGGAISTETIDAFVNSFGAANAFGAASASASALTPTGAPRVIATGGSATSGRSTPIQLEVAAGDITLVADKSVTTTALNAGVSASAFADIVAFATATAFTSTPLDGDHSTVKGGSATVGLTGLTDRIEMNVSNGTIALTAAESITTTAITSAMTVSASADADTYATGTTILGSIPTGDIATGGTAISGTGGTIQIQSASGSPGSQSITLQAGQSITTTALNSALDILTSANGTANAGGDSRTGSRGGLARGGTGGTVQVNGSSGAIGLRAGESITTTFLKSSINADAAADAFSDTVSETITDAATGGIVQVNLASGAIGLEAGNSITTTAINTAAIAAATADGTGETQRSPIGVDGRVDVNLQGGAIGLRAGEGTTLGGGESIIAITTGGGDLEITGKTVEISNLLINTTAQTNSGDIKIHATDSILIDQSQLSTGVNPGAGGNGGTIDLRSPQIRLTRFSLLDSATFGEGTAGNVSLSADAITLDHSNIFSITNGSGNAGSVSLRGERSVSMLGQSSITTAAALGATGSGGNIIIETDALEIKEFTPQPSNAELNGFATGQNINVGFAEQIPFISFPNQVLNIGQVQTYPIEVNAAGTRTFIDIDNRLGAQVEIRLLDEQNNILASNTSSPFLAELEGQGSPEGLYSDPYLSFTFRTPGTYAIQIRQPFPDEALSSSYDLQVSLSDGLFVAGGLSAQTNAAGNAGDIDITANTITLGNSASISTETTGPGAAGNITLSANQLTLGTNAQLSATVKAGSTTQKPGGRITLNVSNLDIAGELGIFAETQGTASAGNLTIRPQGTDPNLSIAFSNNGFISASTKAGGNGGSITLEAPQGITLSGQGRVSVTTSGTGQAGQINLTAPVIHLRDGVTLSGSTRGSGQGGTINLFASNALNLTNATIEAVTTVGSTGNGGDIFIDPITTTLHNSRIALDSAGTGTGGNLQLISDFLHLDRSEISASTAGSDGGSLTLNIGKLLTLRNNSVISTQAGTAGAGGNGGNITIRSPLIVGSGNSDIIANAFEGNGGNINIITQGLFGFTVENTNTPRSRPTNDITASSQFGLSSRPNISQALDPSQSLAVLDTNLADLSSQIDRRCNLARTPNASSFVITGTGGLPPNDRNRLNLMPLWTALDLNLDSTDRDRDHSSDGVEEPGVHFYHQGNYSAAIDSWETALQSPELSSFSQISLLTNLAQAYVIQGAWDKAEEAIDRGLNLLDTGSFNVDFHSRERVHAQLLTAQSYLLTEQGKLHQALRLSQQASDLYQTQNDRSGVIQTQLNQAQILTRQGNFHPALNVLTRLQNLQNQGTDHNTLTAAIDLELGTVHRLLGNYTAAETALERSVTHFSQTTPRHHAAALLALGDNDRDQFVPLNRQFNTNLEPFAPAPPGSRGDINTRAREIIADFNRFSHQALTHYRQVQAIAPTPALHLQALTQELLMTIDLTQARATTRAVPDWSVVETLREQLQSQLDQLPNSSTRLYARLNVVDSILKLQAENATPLSLPDLEELLTQTLAEARTLGDQRAEIQVLGKLGNLSERQQQWPTAQHFTVEALKLAQANGYSDLDYRLSWQLGRIQAAQGHTEAAIVAYNNAIKTLNPLQRNLTSASSEVRFAFRDAIDPIYRELVSLLLSQNTPATPRPENVIQARNLIESLQLSELVNFFQADCDVSNLAQIDHLDPHSAIIYPIILRDRLEVIVSLPGQPLQHYGSALSKARITQGISLIQRELTNPFSQRYLPLAQRLYNDIIRPIETALETHAIQNLVFVLDGPLRNLPMSILHDGEQFLVEKYGIGITPGLQLFDPEPLQQQTLTALVGGLTEARQGFSELPYVQAEVERIARSMPSDVLLDEQFVETNLTDQLSSRSFPVVHLATHGEFGSTPEDTYILTWDDRVGVNEFSQLLQDRTGNNPIELLILSACRTATGDDRAALGLAGVAVRSGARSTLASLWYISDQSTSLLMGKFYELLSQQNMTKAEALRQAQLHLMRDPQYANPYYWAPFVLVGNWL
jgi:CHAT domain-containing protein/lipopolysaccharide biosynthesis regulator YciM